MESIQGLFTKRNVFDLTHERKLSCKMGKLIPMMLHEVVPGDTFDVKSESLIRLAPMLAPMMHRVNVFMHYFFVPTRLIWADWEKFITGDKEGDDATTPPTITSAGGYATKTLADYFGIPTGVTNITHSALPFRAYAKIYNDWFMDQTLNTAAALSTGNGADSTTNTTILSRCWEKDYFTSALKWPQRGTAVSMPLAGDADVDFTNLEVNEVYRTSDNADLSHIKHDVGTWGLKDTSAVSQEEDVTLRDKAGLSTATADLSTATGPTLNELRLAIQVQKWMERNARAGVRYIESILAHFGVRSSDARLQRSEFLGGGKSAVIVSEVIQTSATDTGTPLGELAGHGFSANRVDGFRKSFEEHGYIIGILSVLPRTAYQQGLNRMWSRATRYDYYWPEFAHLGEQGILNKELYAQGTGDDDLVFGYQGRYDEYRRCESTVHGDFRDTLDFWHLGRQFSSLPVLNSTFVTADPADRVFADPSDDYLWIQILNHVSALRPMPLIAEPGFMDHF